MKSARRPAGAFRRGIVSRRSFFLLLLSAAAALVFAQCSHSADGSLVEKIIQAYGGRTALAKVVALRAEGTITAFMPRDRGTYVYVLKRGEKKLLVDIGYSKGSEKRILDGEKGYSGTDATVAPTTGPAYRSMVYQYNQLDLPFGLLDNTFTVRYEKKDRLRGKAVDVLKLTDRSGNVVEIAVDRDTHRIVRTSGTFVMGGAQAVLSSELSDFRKTGGVLFPFTIVNYADGFRISRTTITKYTINPVIGSALFSP